DKNCDSVIAGGDPQCQNPHARRNRRSRLCRLKSESGAEHTNCMSCKAINPARNSTTGSKPNRRFAAPKSKPSTKTDFQPSSTWRDKRLHALSLARLKV